jgi:hypothetical protein
MALGEHLQQFLADDTGSADDGNVEEAGGGTGHEAKFTGL